MFDEPPWPGEHGILSLPYGRLRSSIIFKDLLQHGNHIMPKESVDREGERPESVRGPMRFIEKLPKSAFEATFM
eukprot:3392460-Pyramimonas_sp.AAC.1